MIKKFIRTITSRSTLNYALAFMLTTSAFAPLTTSAEGSKEIAPNTSNLSGLMLAPDISAGSYLGAPADNRIYFRINDLTERFHFGFQWEAYNGNTDVTNMYYRIYNPAGTQVGTPVAFANTAGNPGYITTLAQAQAGPNIGAVTTGYTPITFTPTAGTGGTGEYYIVFYNSADGGATQSGTTRYKSAFFDLTVASSANIPINGRVFSRKWSLAAYTSATGAVEAAASASPTFLSYSADSTLTQITFRTGFRPLAYEVITNALGAGTSGTWAADRLSYTYGATYPVYNNGFRLFLNDPRPLYPVPDITQAPTLANPAVLGCAANYTIRYNMPAAGDARIVIDLNGTAGYQAGSADRILEAFNVTPGINTISWDGKDGLGANVATGASMSINAVYQRGRFNIPIIDAEVNSQGLNIATVAPLTAPSNRLYWNDATLTNTASVTCGATTDNQNNNTGAGIDNSFLGTDAPARAWNGNGNPTQVIPAPAVGSNDADNLQCNDFGNVRVLNSWGWALQNNSAASSVNFGCTSLSGTIWNDVDGSAAGTFTGIQNGTETGTNAGGNLFVTLVDGEGNTLASVAVAANGTWTLPNIPRSVVNLPLRLTATLGTVGTAAPAAIGTTFNTTWTNTSPVTRTISTTGTTPVTTGLDFGIEQRPTAVAGSTATQNYNPIGTQVPATTFAPTDANGGTLQSITISAFPTGAASININGTNYTNATWPGTVTVPTNAAGNPTQAIFVVPSTPTTSVVIPYQATDNAGKLSTNTANITVPFANSGQAISGNAWDDANGNAIKDAAEAFTNAVNAGEQLYAILVQTNNTPNGVPTVVSSVAITSAATGAYSFSDVATGNSYEVRLASKAAAPASGVAASTVTANLATNWTGVSTNNSGTLTTGLNTNAPVINIGTFTAAKTGVNFGLDQRPVAVASTAATQNYNPIGTQVPATQFAPTDADPNGNLTSITITAFPTGAASIRINGTNYTNATWPGPITVPTNASGNPTQAIFVVPSTPTTSVVIPYQATDNASIVSANTANITIPFANSGLSISGTAWNDPNGNGIKDATEAFTTAANAGEQLYAILIQTNNTPSGVPAVLNSVAITSTTTGAYNFSEVPSGNTYEIRLASRTSAPTAGTAASTLNPSIATNWRGVSTNNNGATTTALNTNAPVINIGTFTASRVGQGFGIEQMPASTGASYTIAQPGAHISKPITAANSMGALAGTDPEDGALGAGKNVTINSVTGMNGNTLLYNGTVVTAGFAITNYDPNLLRIRFDGTNSTSASFTFSIRDNADIPSPSPATVTISWAAPLPVTILSFDAVQKDQNILLHWKVTNENNIADYGVLFSTDGKSWSEIGRVNAKNSSDYSYTHTAPVNGNNYYKLQVNEVGGANTFSKVITLLINEANTIQLYPNPVMDKLHIALSNPATVSGIQLSDVSGRVIKRYTAPYASEYDLNSLTPGVYYISVYETGNEVKTFKITKN